MTGPSPLSDVAEAVWLARKRLSVTCEIVIVSRFAIYFIYLDRQLYCKACTTTRKEHVSDAVIVVRQTSSSATDTKELLEFAMVAAVAETVV